MAAITSACHRRTIPKQARSSAFLSVEVFNADRPTQAVRGSALVGDLGLQRGQSKHSALTRPFGWEIAEAGHSHSVGESPVDGCLDEVGREEGERDRQVHLPHAAALTSGDAFGIRGWVGNEFVEPTAPPCN